MKRILTMILVGMTLFISCEQKKDSDISSSKPAASPSAVTLTLEGSGN